MDVLHVSCAAEGRYVPHSAAMLHAVLAHRGARHVRVHYLHGPRFPARPARRLAEMVARHGGSISYVEIPDKEVAELPTVDEFTAAMWYRIFLPELLPDVERILYLDVDTIVTSSLEPLWQTDLSGYYIGAVTNVFLPHHLHRPTALGLAGTSVYFNSGVLLMNLAEMRREGSTGALYDFAVARGSELLWPDQDALNVVLGARRLPLHPRWNCMNSVLNFPWSGEVFGADAVAEARRRPGIRHFEGPALNKPWHYMCEQPLREAYFAHRRQTPWPRCRLEGITPSNVVKRARRRRGRRTAQPLGVPAAPSVLDRDAAGVVDPVEEQRS